MHMHNVQHDLDGGMMNSVQSICRVEENEKEQSSNAVLHFFCWVEIDHFLFEQAVQVELAEEMF